MQLNTTIVVGLHMHRQHMIEQEDNLNGLEMPDFIQEDNLDELGMSNFMRFLKTILCIL
jgi:hypothetical protein